jgi:hypothetical protein
MLLAFVVADRVTGKDRIGTRAYPSSHNRRDRGRNLGSLGRNGKGRSFGVGPKRSLLTATFVMRHLDTTLWGSSNGGPGRSSGSLTIVGARRT